MISIHLILISLLLWIPLSSVQEDCVRYLMPCFTETTSPESIVYKEAKVPYQFFPVKGVGHGVPAPHGQAFHYIEALFIYQYLE